ncbi:hypothetical protein CSB20_09840 [bacterium DOLZORAL124_64_63]|nr:MAG: hypothetical protein CSB20_09840 [bacterium DOLZORAL124_64_63]
MFAVSSMRRWVFTLMLALLAVTFIGLAGCSKEEEVDPYAYDSLRRITRGDTLSVGFLFEIDAPELEYVQGDVAIVRDGNLLEFLVGPDLENSYAGMKDALLGVKKTFSPQPTHLVIQRIKRNGSVVQDSIPRPKGYVLPHLLRSGAIDQEMSGAPLPEIGWKTKDYKEAVSIYLPEKEDDPQKTIKSAFLNIVHRPRVGLPDSVAANPSEEDMAWYVIGDECSLEIVDLAPGADYMLDLLVEKDLPLIGAFTVVELEDQYKNRKIAHEGLGHVVGKVRLPWFQYANTYIQGYVEE